MARYKDVEIKEVRPGFFSTTGEELPFAVEIVKQDNDKLYRVALLFSNHGYHRRNAGQVALRVGNMESVNASVEFATSNVPWLFDHYVKFGPVVYLPPVL